MEVTHVDLEHWPENPKTPFFLVFTADGKQQLIWLTEAQVSKIWEKATTPLMRARASRSTPGLVHP